jgi:C-terminal processing protease CtpA/Prc
MTKVGTLTGRAAETLKTKKEEIAVNKLIQMDNQINEMEKALRELKNKKAEFEEREIEDIELHDFQY